jgi:hypothetical protein
MLTRIALRSDRNPLDLIERDHIASVELGGAQTFVRHLPSSAVRRWIVRQASTQSIGFPVSVPVAHHRTC